MNYLFVAVVKGRSLPAVDHRPEKTDALQLKRIPTNESIVKAPGERERTLHDDLIGFDRDKHFIQRREDVEDTFGVDRTRQIIEDNPGPVTALQNARDLCGRFGRHASDDGPKFTSRGFELPYHHQFVIIAVSYGFQFPFALGMDRPLGIVAVHNQYIVPHGVVQATGEQHRKGRFSYAALLIADREIETPLRFLIR